MSLQLESYLNARAQGLPIEGACSVSGIDDAEAELWEQAIERGEVELPRVRARAREDEPKEENMARDCEATTTIKVGDGPEIAIDLGKGIDAPENADAKEAISGMFENPATQAGQVLKRYIERAERLEAEIKDLNSDKSDLFKEAKDNGFDTKTIKRIIRLRKMGSRERQEAEALLSTYMNAIGMTPIEEAIALAAAA